MIRLVLILLLLFNTGPLQAAASIITAARLSAPLQIEMEIKGKLPASKLFTLHHPERVVLDLNNTHSRFKLDRLHDKQKKIKQIRTGRQANHSFRMVIEVDRAYQPVLHSKKLPNGRYQMVIRLTSKKKSAASVAKKSSRQRISPPSQPRDVIVVLDPGHGGKDPGAIGPGHRREKDLVLAIARRLKTIVDQQPGMKAVLTRKGDYYIGLRERLQIARKEDADIFVAIHADAFINRQSNGASVFALSQNGATSEAARWLAEKENYSELGGVNLAQLNDDNGMVRSVLIDLSQTATISASVNIGQRILKSLGKMTRLHNETVEQARFVVLKSPDIPSVLVETGFISNPREERNLSSPRFQARMARALFQGIKAYFWEFPPYGSQVELLSAAKTHIVKRGETLSGIANRYHRSQKSLTAANKLSNSRLQIGQKLVIPTA